MRAFHIAYSRRRAHRDEHVILGLPTRGVKNVRQQR